MFIAYDLIFLIFTLIYLPIYLFKGKFHKGFLSRLGVLPRGLDLGRPIWVHAVSVGEAIVVRGLIEELRKCYPARKFVISTVTPTGNKIVKAIAEPGDLVIYLPLDFSFVVKGVISRINPEVFIIAETEIWPNLITCLHKKNIPIITVNGRISDASFRGYLAVKPLIKPILNKINLFCVQTESDADRLKQLGVATEKIKVTGNMKFDQLVVVQAQGYRQRLGLALDEKLFIAGSTHSAEEEIVLAAYKAVLNNFPGLKLLIAPRHPQRAKGLLKTVSAFGLSGFEISRLPSQGFDSLANHVFILDTIGELANFYALADIVFMGGSLIKKGGHNILEPANLGKPVIFGPHMFNFRDIAGMFLKNNAAIMVHNQLDLASTVELLLNNSLRVRQMTDNAREVIMKNQGATKRNIQAIGEIIGL